MSQKVECDKVSIICLNSTVAQKICNMKINKKNRKMRNVETQDSNVRNENTSVWF